jgi:hypothetical protein
MDYETRFPARLIDENELTDLVERLAKFSGAVIDAEKIYVISTDDAEFSGVLDTLAEGLIRKGKSKKLEGRVMVRKTRKPRSSQPVEKNLGLHSYRNETTGEIVSKQWINKRLAENNLARGTIFVNGHDERFMVVSENENGSGPFSLAKGEQA